MSTSFIRFLATIGILGPLFITQVGCAPKPSQSQAEAAIRDYLKERPETYLPIDIETAKKYNIVVNSPRPLLTEEGRRYFTKLESWSPPDYEVRLKSPIPAELYSVQKIIAYSYDPGATIGLQQKITLSGNGKSWETGKRVDAVDVYYIKRVSLSSLGKLGTIPGLFPYQGGYWSEKDESIPSDPGFYFSSDKHEIRHNKDGKWFIAGNR